MASRGTSFTRNRGSWASPGSPWGEGCSGAHPLGWPVGRSAPRHSVGPYPGQDRCVGGSARLHGSCSANKANALKTSDGWRCRLNDLARSGRMMPSYRRAGRILPRSGGALGQVGRGPRSTPRFCGSCSRGQSWGFLRRRSCDQLRIAPAVTPIPVLLTDSLSLITKLLRVGCPFCSARWRRSASRAARQVERCAVGTASGPASGCDHRRRVAPGGAGRGAAQCARVGDAAPPAGGRRSA